MANADRPRGAACKGKPLRINAYEAGSACYPGDFVSIASDGQVDPTAAGGKILGVCMSYASAAGAEVLVADHPDQLVVVQASSTEVDAQTDIGNNADIVANSPSTTYKTSRQELDSSTLGTSAAQLCIIGIESRPDNALGANVDVICRINEHQLEASFAGV